MECEVSPNYRKDENKDLHFFCDYCDEEMKLGESRKCSAKPEMCRKCGKPIGWSDLSMGRCIICKKKL